MLSGVIGMTDEKKSAESIPANEPDVPASAGQGTEDVHELPPGEVIEEELVGGRLFVTKVFPAA